MLCYINLSFSFFCWNIDSTAQKLFVIRYFQHNLFDAQRIDILDFGPCTNRFLFISSFFCINFLGRSTDHSRFDSSPMTSHTGTPHFSKQIAPLPSNDNTAVSERILSECKVNFWTSINS